jgi:putative hemolysin
LDYHSVYVTSNHLLLFLLALTPAAATVLIFTLVILFLLSFLVSGSEIAFFSFNTKDINVLKTRQHPSYRRILDMLEQPKTLLASMLITNSLANIGIILIANILIDNWVAPLELSIAYVFAIKIVAITFLVVLFAEILPKVWATHQRIRFASAASLMIEIFNSLFSGLSKRLVRFNDNFDKRLTPENASALDNSSIDDAIDLLPEHEASTEEKQILKGIRKFGDTEVKQIMRTRMDVSGIEYDTNFHDVLKRVEDLHYSRLPVYKNNLDDPAGMLHTKDLLPHLHEAADFDWHTLIRTPYFVHEQKLIEDLLQEFRNKRIHFAIVADEFGGTSGIVTLEDIMEEIIGDIKDEFDDEESGNKKLDDYNYIFEGKLMINDACKAMGVPVDTFDNVRGESDSVAGLVLEIAGEFPAENTNWVSGEFTLIPLQINKNRIDKVKISIQHKQPEQE